MSLGEQLKLDGMTRAALNKAALLIKVQDLALEIGAAYSTVTVNDVRAYCEARGIDFEALGNAAGSIFKGKRWTRIGYAVAKHPLGHARTIGLWTRKDISR